MLVQKSPITFLRPFALLLKPAYALQVLHDMIDGINFLVGQKKRAPHFYTTRYRSSRYYYVNLRRHDRAHYVRGVYLHHWLLLLLLVLLLLLFWILLLLMLLLTHLVVTVTTAAVAVAVAVLLQLHCCHY